MKKTTAFLITALSAAMIFNCASNVKTSAATSAADNAASAETETAAQYGAPGGGGPKTRYVAIVESEIDAQSGAAAELNPADARQITAALRREAVENLPRGTYHIMTTETVLSMGGAVLEECSDENCVVTLGAKIGADYIVRGTISKIGTKFTMSAEMYETDNGTLVASSEYVRADNAAELLDKTVEAGANMYRKFIGQQGGAVAAKQEQQTAAYTAPVNKEVATAYKRADVDGAGIITDSRDGKKYKTVMIGGKRWMAENLNYQTSSGSWCDNNDDPNCGKYGRLYDWKTAKTICPGGFHLPPREEWKSLVDYAGGDNEAGKKLKAISGWAKKGFFKPKTGNGTDDFGFSALPGGFRGFGVGVRSIYPGMYGSWWSATELDSDNAYYRLMYNSSGVVYESYYRKGFGLSVRCVAD